MFGRSALASISAAASLALILLAAAQAQANSGQTGAGPSGSPGVTRAWLLIVEPGAGFSPVYKRINGARRSIDLTSSPA